MYVIAIIIVVASNVMYHIVQKNMPQKSNPFTALIITYTVAAVVSVIAFQFYKTDKGFFESFKDINWASIALGICITGLEFGYLMAYRAGWNISVGSLVSNIIMALILIPIGILFFKEGFELRKVFGALFCIVGLILINKWE